MSPKEKAIRTFAKAMKTANPSYIAEEGRFTQRLHDAWWEYVDQCQLEVKKNG